MIPAYQTRGSCHRSSNLGDPPHPAPVHPGTGRARQKLLLAVLVLLALPSLVLASPTVHYVWETASGANDGTSWENAFTEVKAALHIAQSGDEIRVAAGVYRTDFNPQIQSHTQNRFDSIELKPGVVLYGGYQLDFSEDQEGQPFMVARDPDPLTNHTVLSGFFGTDPNNDAHYARRVVHGVLVDGAVLDGFTIRGGRADDSSPAAGALIHGNPVVIRNCRFIDNHADIDLPPHPSGAGGGMRISSGEVLLENVRFEENRAARGGGLSVAGSATVVTIKDSLFFANSGSDGGGIGLESSATLRVEHSHFSTNEAVGALFSTTRGGGAIAQWGSSRLEILGSTFEENDSTLQGGGAIANASSLASTWIRDCVFLGNKTRFSGRGGGVYAVGPLDVASTRFTRNRAYGDGGAIATINASTRVYNAIFEGNLAGASSGGSANGGAVQILATNNPGELPGPVFANCVFVGNRANPAVSGSRGGAVDVGSGITTPDAVMMVNCTFTANSAHRAGGIHFASAGPAIAHAVHNCILWNNTATEGGMESQQIDVESGGGGPVVTVGHTMIEGLSAFAGNENTAADPLFVLPPSPGPDATWGTPDDDYGNLRPGLFSPALDSGDNAALPPDHLDLDDSGTTSEPLPLDLAGNPRRLAAPGVAATGAGDSPLVDRGAYETHVLHVDATAAGSPDGSTWSRAFPTLPAALAAAAAHTTILVAEGVYPVEWNASESMAEPMEIDQPLAILCGFPSGGGDFLQRNPFGHPTIFDGATTAIGDDAHHAHHVFRVAAGGFLALDGCTVRGGRAVGGSGSLSTHGGGVVASAPVVLSDVRIDDCFASGHGGGLHLLAGGELTRVDITDCVAEGNGGALYYRPTAASTNPSKGGLAVYESSFIGNAAETNGGSVFMRAANSHSSQKAVVFHNTTFSGNQSSGGGGAMIIYGMTVDLRHCTINNNTAGGGGGAAMVAMDSGGFGLGYWTSDGTVNLRGNIIAVNSDAGDREIVRATGGQFLSEGYNLVRRVDSGVLSPSTGDLFGTETSPVFPELEVLTGDPATFTRFHPLSPDSPCLDAAGTVALRPTDQRGLPRKMNGAVDMGAWEWHLPRFLTPPFMMGRPPDLGDSVCLAFDAVGDDTVEWFMGHPTDPETPPINSWTLIASGDNPIDHVFVERTQTVWVRLTNAHGQAISAGVEVEVSGTSPEFWRWQTFGTAAMLDPDLEDSLWGWTADPNGNGIDNRFSWHLGRDPLDPNAPSQFTCMALEEDGGEQFLTLEFRRRFNHPGLELHQSNDLVDWVEILPDGENVILTVLEPDPLGDETVEDLRLRFKTAQHPQLFFRFTENPDPPEAYPRYTPNDLAFPIGTQLNLTETQDAYGRTLTLTMPVIVTRVHSITGNRANLVVDASGSPATPSQYDYWKIDDAEREAIASDHAVGEEFLRAVVNNAWAP